jgi:hypothetical protein
VGVYETGGEMTARNRKQMIFIDVVSGNVDFMPKGTYSVYIDSAKIVKGSVQFIGRILNTVEPPREERRDEKT